MHSYGQVTISSHRGGVVITEVVYTWLKQVITFYIISSLLINVVVSDKYKDYIRMITRIILVLIIISPVIKQAGGNIIKNSIDTFYKDYSSVYYKNNADNTNGYSFTVRDVVIKTVRLQVAEVLGEYNMQADNIDVAVSDVASGDYGNMTVEKVVIHINRLKKSDIDTLKEKISAKTGIDVGSIYIK